jgi:predicted nuclease of predicted toxin-antitoxin system
VRILLDECVDWRLGRDVVGHDVKTVRQMGWESFTNGRLLALAEQSFDVFVTADANLRFQQTLEGRPLRVVVLRPRRNRLAELRPLVPRLLGMLPTLAAGSVTTIAAEPATR